MSRHIWVDDNGYTVTVGYNRPLNYFFLLIYNEADELVFSNLELQKPAMTIERIANILFQFKLFTPYVILKHYLPHDQKEEKETGKSLPAKMWQIKVLKEYGDYWDETKGAG